MPARSEDALLSNNTNNARFTGAVDLSSPWTYLAFHNIQRELTGKGIGIQWRPFLVGGVFNAVNQQIYSAREQTDSARFQRSYAWLREWAQLAGIDIHFPTPHHPMRSVLAMRCCCTLEDQTDSLLRFARAAYESCFGEQKNIDDPEVMLEVARRCELDGEQLLIKANQQNIKDKLRANTQEAIDRGAYGSPSIFVDREHLYFGNDQLPLVLQRLTQPP